MQKNLHSVLKSSFDNEIIKLLLEHTTLGVVICDRSEFVLDANNFILDLLGVSKEKILSQKISKFFSLKESLSSNENFNLEEITDKSNSSLPKILNVKVNRTDQVDLVLTSHIYTRALGDDLYLVCLFDNYLNDNDIQKIIKDYDSFICPQNHGKNNIRCEKMDELIRSMNMLSKETLKATKLKEDIENSLLREKEHSEFKSRFVSIASHELRTPLGGILTSASLLEKYNENGTVEQRRKHIEIIKGQVGMLTSILNDFLSFDRLDRPEVRVNLKMFSLVDFFEDFIESYSDYSNAYKRIKYKHVGKDVIIYQDSDLLLKIIINIVSNSLKYSEETQSVEIISELKGKDIHVKIKDYGIGIPISEKNFIWDLFYRCENTSGIQGTGLGLNIAKLCVDLVHGKISCVSDLEKGAEFNIFFPKGANL